MQNEYSPICIFQFSFFIFQSAKTPLPAVHDKFWHSPRPVVLTTGWSCETET